MKHCFYACVITVLCLCTTQLHAQQIMVLNNNESDLEVSPYAYVWKGAALLSDASVVVRSDSSHFLRNPQTHEVDYGVGQTRGWCAVTVRNESDQREWVLRIQHSRVDTTQLYIVRADTVVEEFPMTGHFQTLTKRPIHSLPFGYPISLAKNETATLYVFTERQYGRHAAIMRLQTKEHFESYEYGFSIILGIVCGMVILAAFVGFFLWVFSGQRLYIYYCIYALSFFFVLLADTGVAHAIRFFPLNETVVSGFTMIAYYWMGGCLGIFTIELLQLKHHGKPWTYWFGTIMSYMFCVFALLLLIPWLPEIMRATIIGVSYYFAAVVNIFILYLLSVSVIKKDPIVYFYMAGFYFTSLIALLLTLSDFHLIHFPAHNKDIYFLTPLVEILCVALGIGIHFSRTQRERINVQLALNQTQDQIITIQEDERRRIAQDLHDDVGNSLAAIKNMVIHKRESISVEKEIDNIIQTVRAISHDLMPVDFNEFSLVDIITHTVNKFRDHPTLALEFDHSGKVIRLKPLTELVIYRIINELITNIYKHSKASKALIQLIYQDQSLVVTVEDNGTGIKTARLEEGIGLRSIRLRSEYIRATLKIESDDKGTLIILEVPYESTH